MNLETIEFNILENNNPKLSEEDFLEIVKYSVDTFDNFQDILNVPKVSTNIITINGESIPLSNICGCIGAINGWSICGCTLSRRRIQYRFEIAKYILENNIEIIDKSEKRKLEAEIINKQFQEIFKDLKS